MQSLNCSLPPESMPALAGPGVSRGCGRVHYAPIGGKALVAFRCFDEECWAKCGAGRAGGIPAGWSMLGERPGRGN